MDDYIEDNDVTCPRCGTYPTLHSPCPSIYCDDGLISLYEYDDPLWFNEDDYETCDECHGYGNIQWCPKCGFDIHLTEQDEQAEPLEFD